MLAKYRLVNEYNKMAGNIETDGERFLRTFASDEGVFTWAANSRSSTLDTQAEVENTTLFVGAEFDSYDDPYIELGLQRAVDADEAHDKRARAIVTSPEVLWVNADRTGFYTPLPNIDRLELEVEDEWGVRKYDVPVSYGVPVTVRTWKHHDPSNADNQDSAGEYSESVKTDVDTEILVRKMMLGILSTTVQLARSTVFAVS